MPSSDYDDLLRALADQHAELDALLRGCTDADWVRPTPCEGWDVRDVVLHLAQTDELARASAAGELERFTAGVVGDAALGPSQVDAAAAAAVADQRDVPFEAVAERWRTAAASMRAALAAAPGPSQRVTWITGKLSVHTLAATRLSEGWIHTTDVAIALGAPLAPTDRLRFVARLAWRTLPYAFAMVGAELAGPVAFRLVGPSGDPWSFEPEAEPLTVISGPAADLCDVAARRRAPGATDLVGHGPDATRVLELVRTYAQ